MKLGDHQEMFSRHLIQFIQYAFDQGYAVRFGEVQRPVEMQQLYLKTGRSKTMKSNHIVKCAADIHFVKDGKICYPPELGKVWESLDPLNRWGGNFKNFKDDPHFERNIADKFL